MISVIRQTQVSTSKTNELLLCNSIGQLPISIRSIKVHIEAYKHVVNLKKKTVFGK